MESHILGTPEISLEERTLYFLSQSVNVVTTLKNKFPPSFLHLFCCGDHPIILATCSVSAMSRHCVQTILARQRVAGLQWASTASRSSVGSEADMATLRLGHQGGW